MLNPNAVRYQIPDNILVPKINSEVNGMPPEQRVASRFSDKGVVLCFGRTAVQFEEVVAPRVSRVLGSHLEEWLPGFVLILGPEMIFRVRVFFFQFVGLFLWALVYHPFCVAFFITLLLFDRFFGPFIKQILFPIVGEAL